MRSEARPPEGPDRRPRQQRPERALADRRSAAPAASSGSGRGIAAHESSSASWITVPRSAAPDLRVERIERLELQDVARVDAHRDRAARSRSRVTDSCARPRRDRRRGAGRSHGLHRRGPVEHAPARRANAPASRTVSGSMPLRAQQARRAAAASATARVGVPSTRSGAGQHHLRRAAAPAAKSWAARPIAPFRRRQAEACAASAG